VALVGISLDLVNPVAWNVRLDLTVQKLNAINVMLVVLVPRHLIKVRVIVVFVVLGISKNLNPMRHAKNVKVDGLVLLQALSSAHCVLKVKFKVIP